MSKQDTHHKSLTVEQVLEARVRVSPSGDLHGKSPKTVGHQYHVGAGEMAWALAGVRGYSGYPPDNRITDAPWLTSSVPGTIHQEDRMVSIHNRKGPWVDAGTVSRVRDSRSQGTSYQQLAKYHLLPLNTVKNICMGKGPYSDLPALDQPRVPKPPVNGVNVDWFTTPAPLVLETPPSPMNLITQMFRAVGPAALGWARLPDGASLASLLRELDYAMEQQITALGAVQAWCRRFAELNPHLEEPHEPTDG